MPDMKFNCPHCKQSLEAAEDMLGQHIDCPSCNQTIEIPTSEPTQDLMLAAFGSGYDQQYAPPPQAPPFPISSIRKHAALKNILAVILGMIGGFLVKLIIFIPLAFIFATEDGLPNDLSLILEIFTAFLAGAIAGSLVLRRGWLYGMLTQFLKLILMIVVVGIWGYLVATKPDVRMSAFGPLMSPEIRLMIFSVFAAAIAGAVATHNRDRIMSILGSIFGFLGSSFGCLLHSAGGLFYIYVIYLGGKAIFADGHVLKGLLIVFIVGPFASYLASFLMYGIFFAVFWPMGKIYEWYAQDLDLPPIQ